MKIWIFEKKPIFRSQIFWRKLAKKLIGHESFLQTSWAASRWVRLATRVVRARWATLSTPPWWSLEADKAKYKISFSLYTSKLIHFFVKHKNVHFPLHEICILNSQSYLKTFLSCWITSWLAWRCVIKFNPAIFLNLLIWFNNKINFQTIWRKTTLNTNLNGHF